MNSLLKKLIIVAIATPVFAFAQTPADKVVATVAGEPITAQDVNERAGVNLSILKAEGRKLTKAQMNELGNSSFAELIEERVFLNQARKVGISISESDVAKGISELAQAQNVTADVLKANIMKQGGDKGLAMFNRDIKNELTIRALKKQEVLDKIKVTQPEIDDFLAKNKMGANNPIPKNEVLNALHIYVAKTTPASKKKIDAAKKRITAGESFETVGAMSEADAPVGAGVSIVASDTNADPAVRALVGSLADGAVSDVIKTKGGFHLFKAVSHKTEELTLAKQNDLAKEALTQQRFEGEYKTWYENLVADAKKNIIEIKK